MPPKKNPRTAPGVEQINFEDPEQAKFGCLLLNRFVKTIEHNFYIYEDDWIRWYQLTCSKSPLAEEDRNDLIMETTLSVMFAHPDCQMGYEEVQEEVLHLIDTLHLNRWKDPSEYNYAIRYTWTDLDLRAVALGIYLHSDSTPADHRVDCIKDFALLDVIGDAMNRTRHSIAYVMFDRHEEILDHYKRFADAVEKHGLEYLLEDVEPNLTAAADYYIMDITERLEAEANIAKGDEKKQGGLPLKIPMNPNIVHEPTFLPIIPQLRIPLSTTRRSATAKQLAVANFRR